MAAEQETSKRGINLGVLGGIVILPLLLIAAPLSIPYSFVHRRLARRRERNLHTAMERCGRLRAWDSLREEAMLGNGTFIFERLSFKDPPRWWWTPENIHAECPFVLPELAQESPDHSAASQWLHDRYTGPTGSALLVKATVDEKRSIARVENGILVSTLRSFEFFSPRRD